LASPSTTASVKVSGSLIGSANGTAAVYSIKFLIDPTPTTATVRFAKNGSTTYSDFFTADNSLGQAVPSDVRSGTVYASGNLTGTCEVPSAGSVAFGVPVDATTGTAVLTAAAIRAELAVELARIDAAVSSAGNAPTVAQIRTELDSNSTKLANLDATISSRLAPSGTLAVVTTLTNSPDVPTEAEIASQVRTELSVELGRIDAAISSRLAPSGTLATVTTLTNAPTVPTPSQIASQVRTELSTELNRLDTNVGSRAASGTLASDITAIKAKTDLLETTRLAQCSTVATTGAQLAAALS
jgi:hypothetical protein